MRTGPILVVDDEPVNLDAMRHVLAENYTLVFARNGEDALRAARKHLPLLVLLDVEMPGMDGYAVCRALKADPLTENVPVIFVTGLTGVGEETEGFNSGAVDYIVKPISPPIVRARVKSHLSLVRASRLEQSYRDAIYMLGAAGHFNDLETGVHIWRMAAYAVALAQAVGWKEKDLLSLELAAPMHDTGKIGIPGAILRKPGKLDPDEWEIMKAHTRIGYHILAKSKAPLFALAAEIALRHHERWDGSGYPGGLAGEQIPESARIVAVADVFDALTMNRPYKKAWSIEDAISYLRQEAGSHLDPRLVGSFIEVIPQIIEIKSSWDERELQDENASPSFEFQL